MSRVSAIFALLGCWACVTIEVPRPIDVPASPRAPQPSTVLYVVDATYGGNCGAPWGNGTEFLAKACNGLPACEYRVDYQLIGDPAVGCGKDFVAEWRCGEGIDLYRTIAPPEAGYGGIVRMACDAAAQRAPPRTSADVIEAVSATYGGNCNAPHGNQTAQLAKACNGKVECRYRVDHTIIGDPVPGCGKDYVAEWRCGGSRSPRKTRAAPEAGYGEVIVLRCSE
jgi:hypothetical protein